MGGFMKPPALQVEAHLSAFRMFAIHLPIGRDPRENKDQLLHAGIFLTVTSQLFLDNKVMFRPCPKIVSRVWQIVKYRSHPL